MGVMLEHVCHDPEFVFAHEAFSGEFQKQSFVFEITHCTVRVAW